MAYIEFSEAGGALLDRGIAAAPKSFVKPVELTPLEWQVVAIAQGDRISSILPAGPVTRAIRWLFGLKVSNALSDGRLEALRRMAVLSWHRGYSVASEEVRAFLSAGFTLDHYDLLLTRINAARAALPRKFHA
ncbi:MAG: hypothetical protein V4530_00015 [Pseudomonadota bacterium]